eukprot:CAMPEP_0197663300 /NCGR_PEP_ID=MMETSP1338-20131121/56898_1 /TAXON_ID=43686 ORGANISM="Pelagodinium beii, Strain RCC1491" /NCGR_SAMPLE_ID=MMETSP1338 /ASSEMBLY_ACC=CAM_ASM_000754 /LENGTH=212 /DNA_ID=CAMNT_0043241597 /DNA_START=27 /DNA_END=665 /DNA_ORIENTATION=-
MGIVKRSLSPALELELESTEKEDLREEGQIDIRSYLVPAWRWSWKEDFSADEAAAKAMDLGFGLEDEESSLVNWDCTEELYELKEKSFEDFSADEAAAISMGLSFGIEDEEADLMCVVDKAMMDAEPENDKFEADEAAAKSMGLGFSLGSEASCNEASPGTPPRRRAEVRELQSSSKKRRVMVSPAKKESVEVQKLAAAEQVGRAQCFFLGL